MSSWQQALSEDFRKGKKRESIVVLNGNQQKNLRTGRDDPDSQSWICKLCEHPNMGTYYRCKLCNNLKPEERANRLEIRARDGEIGRGGGYFQRAMPGDHREWNSDDEEYDEFGRKKRKSQASGSTKAKKAQSAATSTSKETMSEKQNAALARLREKVKGKRGSRSRSAHRSRSRSAHRSRSRSARRSRSRSARR